MKPWREEEPPTPRDTPQARRRESLLPPRALPGIFGVAAAAFAAASAVAQEVMDPRARALVLLAVGFGGWLVGYVTPPPRRRFRRGDR